MVEEGESSSSIPNGRAIRPRKTLKDVEQFPKTTRQVLKLFLPSTYVRKIFPSRFYRGCCTASAIFWFVIGVLVIRKTQTATKAVRYIKAHSNTVALETIEQSDSFARLINMLDSEFTRPPAFFLLNQYALNMTFNFLCNTQDYAGAHDRFIFVTLDSVAKETLEKYWPNVRQFYWPTPSLYVS
jgi:hypothetical protein